MKEKPFFVDAAYLNLPVRPGAPFSWVSLHELDGGLLYEFYAELDFQNPAYYVSCPLERWRGRRLHLRIEGEGERGLEGLLPEPARNGWTRDPDSARPKVHFTPYRGILGDPNGLYAMDGRYHAFFQHNPYGTQCGDWLDYCNFGWTPAVSGDLCRWREEDPLLLPDKFGPAFSGTAFVDEENASGMQEEGGPPPVLLFYTAAGGQSRRTRRDGIVQTQRLMVSTDGGRRFTPYAGNPVLPAVQWGNRDPKVFRHRESGRYILVLYAGEGYRYFVYGSPDLLHWDCLSEFAWDDWECPDVLEVPLEGEDGGTQMVFWSARGYWAPVSFDGTAFTKLAPARLFAPGGHIQCGQSFTHLPGRCIQLHRFNVGDPRALWYGAFSLPYELTSARLADGGYALRARPAREVDALEIDTVTLEGVPAGEGAYSLPAVSPCRIRIEAEFGEDGELDLRFGGFSIQASRRMGSLAGNGLPVDIDMGGRLLLDIFWDGPLAEVFETHSGKVLPLVSMEEGPRTPQLSGRSAQWKRITCSALSPGEA